VTNDAVDLARLLSAVRTARPSRVFGRVVRVTGLLVEAAVPGVRLGEVVEVTGPAGAVQAEVVGFAAGERAQLLLLGASGGIGPDSEVRPTGAPLTVGVGEELLGRVLDGLGTPLDGRSLPTALEHWPVDRPAPDAFTRRRIEQPLPLGIRAIDALCTVGRGQRLGLFAGAGVGKSTLLGQIARNARADVAIIALVGERGRELREFVEDALGAEGLRRSVVVCATSDQPALVRLRAAFVATAIAEWFRERGGNVLFMLDTVTRLARAQREVGLAAGEPPARQGYPPSVFSMLPRLLERTGNSQCGDCTALYTCLVAGDDLEDPIADEVRGILDGHIVLDRRIAERGRWPAIDVLASLSRVMPQVTSPDHRRLATRMRALLAAYEQRRDLILLGAYQRGSDALTDEAIDRNPALEEFLAQAPGTSVEDTLARLAQAVEG
jgi:type III secretion protein N (ATPase)